jgi:hypothetical protein
VSGGNGSGKNGGGDAFDDFDALIRDRDDDFEVGGDWENPRADYDPYEDFRASQAGRGGDSGSSSFADRGLVDAITRIIESLAGSAGDALAPDTRRQLEKLLRDLLVVLRDVIDAMIERIDNRRDNDFEIEEIPVD